MTFGLSWKNVCKLSTTDLLLDIPEMYDGLLSKIVTGGGEGCLVVFGLDIESKLELAILT